MIKEKLWMSMEMLIKRTDKSFSIRNTVDLTNNSILSMLMTGRVNHKKVNLMKNLV